MATYTLEKHLRIYNDSQGVFIRVRPNPDCPDDLIQIDTDDEASGQWYGECCISITKEEAKLLAQALLEITKND